MLKFLESVFDHICSKKSHDTLAVDQLRLAGAALLVEVATIDQTIDSSEQATLKKILTNRFELNDAQAYELIENAKYASENAASLYDFTQAINRHYEYSQKLALVESLWKVAFADGHLDKYEEHIIRRIADLIHLRHSDFIQTKIQVRGSLRET